MALLFVGGGITFDFLSFLGVTQLPKKRILFNTIKLQKHVHKTFSLETPSLLENAY